MCLSYVSFGGKTYFTAAVAYSVESDHSELGFIEKMQKVLWM